MTTLTDLLEEHGGKTNLKTLAEISDRVKSLNDPNLMNDFLELRDEIIHFYREERHHIEHSSPLAEGDAPAKELKSKSKGTDSAFSKASIEQHSISARSVSGMTAATGMDTELRPETPHADSAESESKPAPMLFMHSAISKSSIERICTSTYSISGKTAAGGVETTPEPEKSHSKEIELEPKPMPKVLPQVMLRQSGFFYEIALEKALNAQRVAAQPKAPISVDDDIRNKNINTLLKISTDNSIQWTISQPSSYLIATSKIPWYGAYKVLYEKEGFNPSDYVSNRTSKNQAHEILTAIESLKKSKNIDITASLVWDSAYDENGYSVHLKKDDVDKALVDEGISRKSAVVVAL